MLRKLNCSEKMLGTPWDWLNSPSWGSSPWKCWSHQRMRFLAWSPLFSQHSISAWLLQTTIWVHAKQIALFRIIGTNEVVDMDDMAIVMSLVTGILVQSDRGSYEASFNWKTQWIHHMQIWMTQVRLYWFSHDGSIDIFFSEPNMCVFSFYCFPHKYKP